MSKVIITADLHFGVPDRLRDILWAARAARAYAEAHEIDTTLVLGDLAHDRTAMELEVWNTLYDFLAETKRRGQNWYAFPGNHDMFLKHSWGINSLRPLQDHLTVMQDVRLLTLDDRRFFILPFIHLEKSYMRVLARLEQHYREDDTLLTHIGVRGSTLNTCFLLKDWSCVNFDSSPFRRVYTGHFHTLQSLNNQVFYPGSQIPFKFDEGGVPHGFYVLDLESMQHEFVDIWDCGRELLPGETPPPQFWTMLKDDLPTVDPEIVCHNMIRVVHHSEVSGDEREEVKTGLMRLGARAVRWMVLADRSEAASEALSPRPMINPGELFLRWLERDQKGTEGLDRSVLLRCDSECRHEGDERYVYDEPD